MSDVTDRIGGQSWTIRELFARRFLVDPYQREYQWEKIHLQDLINDLSRRYLPQRKPEHETRDVATYEPYFLGPIVTHKRGDRTLIVDGQQRLTTLMLLLIWLHRLQADRDDAVPGLQTLAVSDHFGKLEFAVEDPLEPRSAVLDALLSGREPSQGRRLSKSEQYIIARFRDLDELFPDELRDDDLPFFIYWLLERVLLVEISTHNDRLALETFETMNDRGLHLSGADLLKVFIQQKAEPADQARISHVWRAQVASLTENDSNGHTAFMKNWLRAKHSRNATDDAAIGEAFVRWLRNHHDEVGLRYPGEFSSWVLNDMERLGKRYVALLAAAKRPTPGFDAVYFNGLNSVTLQLPLILAAVTPEDDDATFVVKTAMVAGFLDILVARHMVNERDYRYDSLAHYVFTLAREIRNAKPALLAEHLGAKIASLPDGFDGLANHTLRHGNRARTKYLLSRITAWLEVNVDSHPTPPTQAEVVYRLRAHEIEHVWANHADYQPQVPVRRFQAVRNRLGGLLLLPKDINAAFGDDRYEIKLQQYNSQNILARSLHPLCYEANPNFRRLIEAHKLPFQPFDPIFDEAAIEHRQRLYRRLCELVWDPVHCGLVVPKTPSPITSTERTRAYFGISVEQLVQRGLVPAGANLVGSCRGTDYHARLTAEGRFVIESGETFNSPSAAAAAVLERPSWPGWTFWRVVLADGTTATLDAIRKTALQQALVTTG